MVGRECGHKFSPPSRRSLQRSQPAVYQLHLVQDLQFSYIQDNWVLILHLSPIRKIRTIVLTNQNDENLRPLKRENTEPIVLIENASEQTLPILNQNLITNQNRVIAIKTRKEKFLLANIVADPLANKEARTLRISIANASLKMITNHHPTNTLIWVKLLTRLKSTNPKAILHRKQACQLHLPRTMFVNVTHVAIPTTWQMLAHRSQSTNKMLRLN